MLKGGFNTHVEKDKKKKKKKKKLWLPFFTVIVLSITLYLLHMLSLFQLFVYALLILAT